MFGAYRGIRTVTLIAYMFLVRLRKNNLRALTEWKNYKKTRILLFIYPSSFFLIFFFNSLQNKSNREMRYLLKK